jgi:hypothetical protein
MRAVVEDKAATSICHSATSPRNRRSTSWFFSSWDLVSWDCSADASSVFVRDIVALQSPGSAG